MIALTAPVVAHAALPGRADSVDLLRLSAYGYGLVDAAGPGLAVAMGADGASTFGATGCEDGGFSYRTIIDPRAGLDLHIPESAVRLDIVLRPAHGLRELQVTIGGHSFADVPLHQGWQRVSLPLEPNDRGERRVRLTLSGVSTPFTEVSGLAPEVRGLLHGLRFSAHADLPEGASKGPLFGTGDVLWLEAGESISIPTDLAADQALETATIVTRGDALDLVLRVETVNEQGAAGVAAELPAAFAIPWNVDLSRAGIRTPSTLRIRVLGNGSGAVGLVKPTLTVASAKPAPAVVSARPNRLVIVAVRGLRAAEAVADIPGTTRITGAFATSPEVRAALASLMTGLYPQAHGVVGLQDRLGEGMPLLANLAHSAGWRTVLRVGAIPIPLSDPILAGYDDSKAGGPKTFPQHAEGVLDSLYTAVSKPADQPLLAVALLGDGGAPWLPRGESWKKHWTRGSTPWEPGDGRRAVDGFGDGSGMDPTQRAFAAALRRGKADEVVEALTAFTQKVRALEGDTTLVIIGLGGGQLDKEEEFTPDMVAAPMWVMGGGLDAATPSSSFDLTDVTTTLLAVAALPVPALLPGLDIRQFTTASAPKPSFSATATRTYMAATGLHAMVKNLRAPAGTLFKFDGTHYAVVEDDPGKSVLMAQLEQRMRGWLGAGASWSVGDFSPTVPRGAQGGYGSPCPGGRGQ
ncbi:MAG: hypothetical protein R3F39_20095 [Myxococcota bacterium]